jgi:hypothetical protein
MPDSLSQVRYQFQPCGNQTAPLPVSVNLVFPLPTAPRAGRSMCSESFVLAALFALCFLIFSLLGCQTLCCHVVIIKNR